MHPSDTVQWTNVKRVPVDYPLEKSAVTLHLSLEVISSRISTFMRIDSISCAYHSDHVVCFTMRLVKFVVQLWQHESGDYIMEIQRLAGCAIEMQRIRHGLIQAVTTGEVSTASKSLRRKVRALPDTFQHKPECCSDALKITKRLCQSNFYDQNRLGMENMIALTNPDVDNVANALPLCRAVVYGEQMNADCMCLDLLPYFVDTERGSEPFSYLPRPAECILEEEKHEYLQGCNFGTMHYLALCVLANALQVVAEHDGNRELDLDSTFWRHAFDALVYDLEVAQHRPREAALAAKCLSFVTEVAPQTCKAPIIQDRLLPVLMEANEYGKTCHVSLEKESQKLMGGLAKAT